MLALAAERRDVSRTMDLANADRVWNRAALEQGGVSPAAGDRALAALLLAHGLVMNGGVAHALAEMSDTEIAAAVAGFRFFDLAGVAQILEEFDPSEDDAVVDDRYWTLVPDDGVLMALGGSAPSSVSTAT